ncbi:TIGR04211 family SH3 domain-containing protein [Reinekea sp.]|jgi:SH3 domain protein|uniref:TIGR04211 family SH3 domain-containing protein n=1 Tax=Reinekea sp. TaxID=1970455 RepID=UPI002A82966D|nr:TIGR04211 family SH3 domain-containing protein [Reinekea sp.]
MSFRLMSKLLLAFAILIAAPIQAFAETMWLSDMLWVNVRSGPSDANRILKTVQSGTRMDILEKPEDSDYYRIRTENGLEGWIPSRYLTPEPTGFIQAALVQTEKEQLQQLYNVLDKKYSALLADKGDVNGELETLRADNIQLTLELNRITSISGGAIDLDVQYQKLAEENARLKNGLDVAQAQNQSLTEYNDNKMLYAGGILIAIGIFLGFILPRLSGKRRKDGWS